jgi:hypothetical protein
MGNSSLRVKVTTIGITIFLALFYYGLRKSVRMEEQSHKSYRCYV